MNTQESYNLWASQYDTNLNKTRDLEAVVLRATLQNKSFNHCLEIGCGTGKNTIWLVEKATHVTAVDLSEEMLAIAKSKVKSDHVEFRQADMLQPWTFATKQYDLVTFSLVLEHIENLAPIFENVSRILETGGLVYVAELHPFRQYTGSKARFETTTGTHVVPCFNHHISDFINAANQHGLVLDTLNEYFDNDDRSTVPRILSLIFRKQGKP